VAAVGCAAYAFAITYVMLGAINLLTKVRVSEQHEDAGLDESLHGEKGYVEGAF
jgi:Amt family ammonium transporter